MTVRQLRDLEPGERVARRGHGPENGTVIANGRTLVVEWDSGNRTAMSPLLADLIEREPTVFDQVRR